MTEAEALALTGTFGALVPVGASLIARRLPAGLTIRLALVWVTIFAGAFMLVRLFV